MFTPISPPKALPRSETAFLETLTSKVEAEIKVTPPPLVTEIAIVFGIKAVVEVEFIPLVLNTLEELKQENVFVRTHMDKQEDMFKEQAQTNTEIKGLLQVILSRFPPLT